MDETISIFIESNYTPEMQAIFVKSFNLFDAFNHNEAYLELFDIFNDESNIGTDGMVFRFNNKIKEELDYLLEQHGIRLSSEATLQFKTVLLDALFRIMYLEDYEPIERQLETFNSDEEKLSNILADIAGIDSFQIQTQLEEVSETNLIRLKQFIQTKKTVDTLEFIDLDLKKAFVSFIKFSQSQEKEHIAGAFVKSGGLIGARFKTYMRYLSDDMISSTDSQTAWNILSVIMLSQNGYKSPIENYRKISLDILPDLTAARKIEVEITKILSSYDEFKRVQDAKDRLPKEMLN
jgi:hypothetical protein